MFGPMFNFRLGMLCKIGNRSKYLLNFSFEEHQKKKQERERGFVLALRRTSRRSVLAARGILVPTRGSGVSLCVRQWERAGGRVDV